MSADDLRFLCDLFQLKRGGSKKELVLRLFNSGYSAEEIKGPAMGLALGNEVEEFVPKSLWINILGAHSLASGGSRHELLLRLIENELFNPRQTLESLSPSQVREIHHNLFNRVPTAGVSSAIAEILNAFGISDKENEPSDGEEVSRRGVARKEVRSFEYDIALSFAGEQRAYVEEVAKIVVEAGVLVFYDMFEEVKMWGKDLPSYLEQLFRERARFCVLFLSADYVRKAFPRWEARAATARLVQEKRGYILPVRFDDTELPGLPPMIKYLDGRKLTPAQVAASILEKLRLEGRD